MQFRLSGGACTALAISLLAGVALAADEPVPALQDLMGAKGDAFGDRASALYRCLSRYSALLRSSRATSCSVQRSRRTLST
jgi:hypothetical protein